MRTAPAQDLLRCNPGDEPGQGSVRSVGSQAVQILPGAATAYERDVLPFVRPFTSALIASLPQGPIPTLLDHGAGTGEVAWTIDEQRQVGEMVLLDPSPSMASRLREVFGGRTGTMIVESTLGEWLAACGDRPPVFDLITSQLVLPFVPDKLRDL